MLKRSTQQFGEGVAKALDNVPAELAADEHLGGLSGSYSRTNVGFGPGPTAPR